MKIYRTSWLKMLQFFVAIVTAVLLTVSIRNGFWSGNQILSIHVPLDHALMGLGDTYGFKGPRPDDSNVHTINKWKIYGKDGFSH